MSEEGRYSPLFLGTGDITPDLRRQKIHDSGEFFALGYFGDKVNAS
jgi:hypothetical protein